VDHAHPFRLENDLEQVPVLRERFGASCAAAGVDDEVREATALVLTELVNNAIEHGCRCPTDSVQGWYKITEADIEIEVTDPGEVLTAEDFSDSDASGFSESGRGAGLFLVQALSDEVHVGRSADGGTTVRIVKRRHAGAAP
jgi:anti-sigma regulatory factor (Ser/Thr protein kinase)